ncbi:uncharacterized protein A4U43_C03F16300 [Asparagus officinalis]|uniref:Methyltransferase type 11 domain-containing protein n=1 Tax=Asparagus officinalis TaxID=4686 RepID=A0A5P1FAJ3_ASPOF|nr:probable methyltransferase PMT19 [Asparagus officinalis]ONK75385.1 uncharacterized protein A4U43_C03F16300 [Asparagus officinalis]
MDSAKSRRCSLSQSLFFPFLLFFSNLLTFYLSSSPFSPSFFSSTMTTDSVDINPTPSLPPEFSAFTSPKPLPLGYNPNIDSSTLHPPIGLPCLQFPKELSTYLSYTINSSCPDDELLAQKLLLKGCEPLPRRRCRPPSPKNFPEPSPLPQSLWSLPSDSSIHWSAYSCKNFKCLVERKHSKAFDDCKDCFDLNGREKTRWITPSSNALDFSIDEVLSLKPYGTIRIGLDIGGGSGTFAVRMKERNITIVTTSMNFNGPFNSFIAARGVVPLYVSISQRLPFFDNTLDIVHSMHVLSNWIPTKLLHFVVFDVYRVLRPGGIFWLDHFFFVEEQMEEYAKVIESVGFEKVKWEVGRKLDRGMEMREMYISAVLEKPLKNSW